MTISPIPRLMHEGYVPATPPKGWRRSDMLIPKKTTDTVSTVSPYRERLAGEVLSALIETGHLEGVEDIMEGAVVISMKVTPELLHRLFFFGSDVEDLEEYDDDGHTALGEHDGREPEDYVASMSAGPEGVA